jgi:ABC-type spermidine/putrescine transport system permease subunit II
LDNEKNGKLIKTMGSFYNFIANRDVQTAFCVLAFVGFFFSTNVTRVLGSVIIVLAVLAYVCAMFGPPRNIKGIKNEYIKRYTFLQGLALLPFMISAIILGVSLGFLDNDSYLLLWLSICAISFVVYCIVHIVYKRKSRT